MAELAQLNISKAVAPLDSATMAEFVGALDEVNALADGAPGFLWRLQAEDGNATSIRVSRNPFVIVNMSVWASADALWAYVYDGRHLEVMRRRREWFRRRATASMVLWWVPDGHRPTVDEGLTRLSMLERRGPGPEAFTFKRAFGPGGEPVVVERPAVAC